MESAADVFSAPPEPIFAKCDVAVRVKPLGAGASDIVNFNEKYGNWRFHKADSEKKEVVFGDVDPKRKKYVYNFPKFVANDDYT